MNRSPAICLFARQRFLSFVAVTMSSFGTTNHPDLSEHNTLLQQNDTSQRWQTTVATLILLLVAYYGWPYLVYETTIKRRLYDFGMAMVPTRFAYVLQKHANNIAGLSKTVSASGRQGDVGTIGQIYHGSGASSVVQRARTLSGFDGLPLKTAGLTYAGLGNWDNSCFQNSVLQGLASLQAFRDYIGKSCQVSNAAGVEVPTQEALKAFSEQLLEKIDSRKTLWPPSILRSMNTWQQQDAQEYFSKIMDAVDKETTQYCKTLFQRMQSGMACLRSRRGSVSVGVDNDEYVHTESGKALSALLPLNPLVGMLSQSLRCKECGFSEGLSLMSFNCLTLNLGLGGDCYLEDLLDEYTIPELIAGVECDECTRLANEEASADTMSQTGSGLSDTKVTTKQPAEKISKVLSTKAKTILFGRLPRNLVVHINRSIFDDWGGQRKNPSLVRFPPILSIGREWMELPLVDSSVDVHTVYELRCVVSHSGRHDNGHYVACGKRGKDWYIFNDEIITKTSEQQVLARGNVFMLFYEKVEQEPILELETPDSTRSRASSQSLQMPHEHDERVVGSKDAEEAPT